MAACGTTFQTVNNNRCSQMPRYVRNWLFMATPAACPGVFWFAQLHLIARDPSHSPFIVAIACSASARSRNATNPNPRDFPVVWSHMTRASLQNGSISISKDDVHERRTHDMDRKGVNALARTSSETSGLKSPTNIWKWCVVSSLCVPPCVAQFTRISLYLTSIVFFFRVARLGFYLSKHRSSSHLL